MAYNKALPFAVPPHIAAICLLCLAWILPGLIGHDPWKPDEAYSFGLVYHILQGGDWVVPTLAGEPFMEKPPLFYLSAALFAWMLSPLLPLHEGAMLTSGFYMALTFLFVGLGGRELYRKESGLISPIVLLGCLGLLIRTHQLITDVSMLAGFAIGLYGLALSLRRPVLAGLWLGAGVGIGFMSKGLIVPGVLGVVSLLLPVLFKCWRNRGYANCLLVALVAATPWLTIWPFALYQRSPALFVEWFWLNNLGSFFGHVVLAGTGKGYTFYLKLLPWYAWPALPLALWALWKHKSVILNAPGIQLPLITFLVMLLVLSLAANARELYALPMLLPLSLLATASLETLPGGAARALNWLGIVVFGSIAMLLWLGWMALMTNQPAVIAAFLENYQADFKGEFGGLTFGIALTYTVLWFVTVCRSHRSNFQIVINWACGITLIWALAMTLWLPFLDATKSYRSMIASLQQALPPKHHCISSRTLGEGQRAMLEYFGGIITFRMEIPDRNKNCDLLLTQDDGRSQGIPEGSWEKIWEGNRPGDKDERYRLYRRIDFLAGH